MRDIRSKSGRKEVIKVYCLQKRPPHAKIAADVRASALMALPYAVR
jgi:hypothetical protein